MAALWADAPDYYSINEVTRTWTSFTNGNGSASLVAGAGRRSGTAAWRNSTGGGQQATWSKTVAPTGDCIVAFALNITVLPFIFSPRTWFAIGDATVQHINVMVNYDGTLSFFRGGALLGDGTDGVLIGSTAFSLQTNVYYHVSIRAKIDSAVGTLSCRINRNEVLNGGTGYSNINTRNGGTAAWSRVTWSTADIGSPRKDFTDVVLCDSSGTVNNDHPGDCAVLVRLPSTGNGTNVGWTPSTGTDHGALVDETVPNDDTDYNQGTASAQRDTYNFPALSSTVGTPRFTITRPCLKLASAGSTNVLDCLRIGGVNYDGATPQSPTAGSYSYFDFIRETDPSTGVAWTVSGINAAEIGVKVQ
jgi:hypothetical protein